MKKAKIAVPSSLPGGLEAEVSAHFGHCDLYTIIDVEDGAVAQTSTLANVPHVQGGCMAPVQLLAQNGVTALIAGGMGMRPLAGFTQVGIDVFYGAGAANVGAAVNAFLRGELVKFSQEHTCSGH